MTSQIEELDLILGCLIWQINQRDVLIILDDARVSRGGEIGSTPYFFGDGVTEQIRLRSPKVEKQPVRRVSCAGNKDCSGGGPTLRRCGDWDERGNQRQEN